MNPPKKQNAARCRWKKIFDTMSRAVGYTIQARWFDISESSKRISMNCCKTSAFDVQNVQKLVKSGQKVVALLL